MDEPKQVNSREEVPGLDLTPIYANKFNVTMGPVTTRFALGEYVAGNQDDVVFTSAVVMPTPDALELARLIISLYHINPGAQAVLKALEEFASAHSNSAEQGNGPST